MKRKYPVQLSLFGEKIKDLRIGKMLTQARLAKLCGVSTRTILRIENGEYAATLEIILAIAQVFEITASDLLQGIKKEKSTKK